MFKFRPFNSTFTNRVSDIRTLQDIALGYLDDEEEANRVAVIAGNMRIGDFFAADSWMLGCTEDE